MPPATDVRATIDDLHAFEGKAELMGRIVPMGPGDRPSEVAFGIAVGFRAHARTTGGLRPAPAA